MDTPSRERGFVPMFAIGIFAIIAFVFGGAMMYTENQERTTLSPDKDQRTEQSPEKAPVADAQPASGGNFATSEPSSRTTPSASTLRSELAMAIKSGGIHPSRLNDIEREIDALAATGADVSELRALLGKLSVGDSSAQNPPPPPPQQPVTTERAETKPFWEYNPSRTANWHYWAHAGTPPACSEPIVLPAPVDLTLVTAILYPGQVRGDGPKDFKPHGGFILKAGNLSVELRAPMDGYLTSAAKFTDPFGLHYALTFQNPCGIQFGGGHFGVLPPDIAAVVDKVPLKGYGESRTEPIFPPYFVKKGQVIVTGLQEKANPERPGFDWGVADLRETNASSKDPRFQSLYGYAPWNTYYGVCWLDLLPPEQESVVRSFPGGDYREGKNSEYCK